MGQIPKNVAWAIGLGATLLAAVGYSVYLNYFSDPCDRIPDSVKTGPTGLIAAGTIDLLKEIGQENARKQLCIEVLKEIEGK